MAHDFLSLPNRFKPREFKQFAGEGGGGELLTYPLEQQLCPTKLKCQTDSVISKSGKSLSLPVSMYSQ